MVKLLDGLYMIAGEKLTHDWDANGYLLTGKEPTLIDCGSVLGYSRLKENLREVGYSPGDIKRVVATHGHWDHVSAMSCLREESDAELWIHGHDKYAVETGDWDLTAAFLYDQPFPKISVDGVLEDAMTVPAGNGVVTVHATPGHTPGSSVIEATISGVTVLMVGDTLWGGFHERVRSNLTDWQESLKKLTEIDCDAVSNGHSPPVLWSDGKRRIAEARQQLGVYFHPWFRPFFEDFQY